MRIILYLPYNTAPRGQWIVRRNADLVGQFATREEAVQHARRLFTGIRAQPGLDAEIKIEDENGHWHVDDARDEATMSG